MKNIYKLFLIVAPIIIGFCLAFASETTKLKFSDNSRALVYSFTQSYYLIQVHDIIYQIKNLELPPQDAELLKKTILTGHVNTATANVKKDSIIPHMPQRYLASTDVKESVRIHDEALKITGTLLYNDSNKYFLIIKSNDYIYQVKRDRLLTSTPELMNAYQEQIELSVPVNDVEYIWTTRLVKTVEL